MRLSARGWVVALAVVGAVASAAAFGPRGLNAIAAPGLVALVAGAWQVYRTEPPSLSRSLPERGERGATVRVRLEVSATPARSARVVDEVAWGLEADGADRELVVDDDTTVEYDLHLAARGRRSVGPATVVVRDVLGLLTRRFTFPDRDAVVVHPRVHRLAGPRSEVLARLHGGAGDDRRAFDGLRTYRRGDPLRDIHWRSSAKQPDEEFVVKQFAIEEGGRTVEIAAGAAAGRSDAMAEAAASVAVGLLESGVRVGLTTPGGRLEPQDVAGPRVVLDHLAEVGHGPVSATARDRADAVVHASMDDVRVTVGTHDLAFSELSGTSIDAVEAPRREAPA